MAMSAPRRSAADLPRAPLELVHPFVLQGGAVTGAELLADPAGPRAVELLRVYRLVLAWTAGGGDPDRDAVLRLEARFLSRLDHDALAAPLAVLAVALLDPAGADRSRVARACLCVAEWAVERNANQTAISFTQLAALACPTQARYAWMTGRFLRRQGSLRDAERWLRRTHRVAVWTGDPEASGLSLNSLGNLNLAAGRYQVARRLLFRALRVSRRHGLRHLEGEISHDLFVAHAERGEIAPAERFAIDAFAIYGSTHPRLPMLAHDVAQFWSERGCYWRTLPIFLALLPRFEHPAERARVLAGAARAAGALSLRSRFEDLWNDLQKVLSAVDDARTAASALHEVGIGAMSLGEWRLAETVFIRAQVLAEACGAADVSGRVDVALAQVRKQAEIAPAHPRNRELDAAHPGDLLAIGLVRTLKCAEDTEASGQVWSTG
jgi:tetratricopeptide (TPR) repeat protein